MPQNTPTVAHTFQGTHPGTGVDVITLSPSANGVLVDNGSANSLLVSFTTQSTAYGQTATPAPTPASGTDGTYLVRANTAKRFIFHDRSISDVHISAGASSAYSVEAF